MRAGLIFAGLLAVLAGCAAPVQQSKAPVEPCFQEGVASWYSAQHQRTADGEHPDAAALIAAHKSLPFGTQVRVTNYDTGRSVVVRISDRGPFVRNRIIDVSAPAARALGMKHDGTAQVRLELADAPAADGAGCPFRGTRKS